MSRGQSQERPLTGYPSIDKPWMRYYDEGVCSAQIPEGTAWDTVRENNKGYPNDVAILYFGKRITYEHLERQAERVRRAFVASGVQLGDNVALCMPAMPEAIYSILALNALGANAVLLNPTFDSQQMHEVILRAGSRLLVAASEVFESVQAALDGTSVSSVVEYSVMNSLGIVAKIGKRKRKHSGSLPWNAFLKRGRARSVASDLKPEDVSGLPAITVFSSGTTGASKGIQLSSRSVNAMILQYEVAGFDMKRQDRYFAQVPIWFSTGIVVTMLVPLALGITVILEPLYDFELLRSHIRKFKPDYLITATGLLEYLISDGEASDVYGCFKYLAIGGEYLASPTEQRFNRWLAGNGSAEGIHKGYGMCECGGAVTSTNSRANVSGSSGIPLPHVVVAAFDVDAGIELSYGERGELRVLTPCRMLGYLNDDEATNAYFHEDELGRKWACTGDMGYVSEDGSVYVDGRLNDSYRDASGEIVYLFDVERAILDIGDVRQCKAIANNIDGADVHVCHVALAPGVDEEYVLREMATRCAELLPGSHFPHYVRLYEGSLPVAPSGKLDTAYMKDNCSDLVELHPATYG